MKAESGFCRLLKARFGVVADDLGDIDAEAGDGEVQQRGIGDAVIGRIRVTEGDDDEFPRRRQEMDDILQAYARSNH